MLNKTKKIYEIFQKQSKFVMNETWNITEEFQNIFAIGIAIKELK